MKQKENPGLGAGVKENAPHEGKANIARWATCPPVEGCPPTWVVAANRFLERRQAVLSARNREESLRAVVKLAGAQMFFRHHGGTYGDLTLFAVTHDAWTYVRLSPAAKQVKAAEVATLVARIDEMCREKYGRGRRPQ